MTPCAVAWDVDGTLVDSEPVHLRALQQVCQDHRVDIADLPDSHFVGVHLHDVWNALAPRFPDAFGMAQWIDQLNHSYLRHVHQLRLMPGAAETMAELSRRGVRQIAVSNSGRAIVDANLSVFVLDAHLEFSISLDDVAAGKPDPAPYLSAAQRLGLPAARVLAVEDSATGLRSARTAGLRTMGYRIRPGPDAAMDRSIAQLRQVLEAFPVRPPATPAAARANPDA